MAEFSKQERQVTLAGVMIVFLLSALDQTIVATAMPRIIAELNGLALYAWVTTAYLLTSTVMVPIWGKLGDLYGRKPVLLASIGFFLAGSWLSGIAGEFGDLPIIGGGMTQLIVWRALQGIGGGGLFTTAFAIIADLYPPRERAKLGGLFGAVFGLASTIGPLVGGYFTDHGTVTLGGHVVAGWRWVFYLNLPLSLLSLFMILFKMPRMSHQARGKIDFVGAVLIIATFVPLLLALTFGGHTHPWTSPTVLGLFAGAAVGLVLYVVAERYASDPILPLELFKNRVFTTANLAGFLVSMSFMSTVAFLPLFMQLGQGVNATVSGLSTLPLMGGLMVSSIICGRLVTRTGRYKPFMLFGVAVTFLGIWLLSQMDAATSRPDLAWRMAVLGVGLGPGQSLFSLAIQNAMPPNQLGVVTSSSQFFRQIGSTMGVALFGTYLTNQLNSGLGRIMPGVDIGKLQGMGLEAAAGGGAPAMPPFVRDIITGAITDTFFVGLYVIAAAAAVVLLIPHVPMRDRSPMGAQASPDKDGETVIPGEAHL
ncbi:MDR family MFS transporter [Phenylobacterium sp.]|jgi:EmrB/QacA subfamily drug resistance transporter|uniref:MDR family MFS transporter n=1 Tax=Phenylobacterium sp. TaxID=1871053 RepID=UPI002F953D92